MDMNYVEHYKMYYQFIAKYNEYQTYPHYLQFSRPPAKNAGGHPIFFKKSDPQSVFFVYNSEKALSPMKGASYGRQSDHPALL